MDTITLPFESAHEDWHNLHITGTLRIERKHEHRVIHVDIDTLRCASTLVQCVDRGSLILDEECFSLTLLRFSPDTLTCLIHEGIQTLAMLLRAKDAFIARQDISPVIRDEVHTALANLGYIPHQEDMQPKPVVHGKEFVEKCIKEPIVPVITDTIADNSGHLLHGLLAKPITALTLSSSTLMRLWGLNIETVNDLVRWEESRLVHALFVADGSKKRTTGTIGLRAVEEIKERLEYFDLQFAPETKVRRGVEVRKGFIRDRESLIANQEIFSLQPEISVSEEMAAEKLGDQYALFKQFREAGGEEQILLRNEIAIVNRGLVGKFSRSYAPQIERRHVGMKIKEEALEEQDLFQEGLIGLLRGVELYDYRRGFAFSTYAASWIKQCIKRTIINQLHPVRLPVHMSEAVSQFIRNADGALYKWHARNPLQDPTREEIAKEIGISVERFEEFLHMLEFHHLRSLDERVEEDEGEADTLGDLIADVRYDPEALVTEYDENQHAQDMVHQLLATVDIKPINRQCVVLWFGLEGNREHTLEEISQRFGVTRQRIQQRIAETLDMLRTQENWEVARTLVPTIARPGKIRKTDIVLRDTPHDRITRLERSNENIAYDCFTFIMQAYDVEGEIVRSGVDLPKHLQSIRRHAIGEMCRRTKLSTGFIAFFFNLTEEMVKEEIAVFQIEWENTQKKVRNQRSGLEWRFDVMKIIAQAARISGLKQEQLFGSDTMQDDDALIAARRYAIIRLREELNFSFNDIADFLHLASDVVARSYARKYV